MHALFTEGFHAFRLSLSTPLSRPLSLLAHITGNGGDSLRGSSVNIGTVRLRKDGTHKSGSGSNLLVAGNVGSCAVLSRPVHFRPATVSCPVPGGAAGQSACAGPRASGSGRAPCGASRNSSRALHPESAPHKPRPESCTLGDPDLQQPPELREGCARFRKLDSNEDLKG